GQRRETRATDCLGDTRLERELIGSGRIQSSDCVVPPEPRRNRRELGPKWPEIGRTDVRPDRVRRLPSGPKLARAPSLAGSVRRPAAIEQRDVALRPSQQSGDSSEPFGHSLFAAMLLSSLRSPRDNKTWPTNASPCKRSAVTLRPFVAAST